MTETIEVTLAIRVSVDAEYTTAEHVDDIVSGAKRLFSTADVRIVDVRFGKMAEAESLETAGHCLSG